MRTEGSEGAHTQPLSPSSSRVRSLRLEVVPKLSSLLLGHGQVGGPHGGGVLEHTGANTQRGSWAAVTHMIHTSDCYKWKGRKCRREGLKWRESSHLRVKGDSFKVWRWIGSDSHSHTAGAYLHPDWECLPRCSSRWKSERRVWCRYGRDTAGLLLTEELKFKSWSRKNFCLLNLENSSRNFHSTQ